MIDHKPQRNKSSKKQSIFHGHFFVFSLFSLSFLREILRSMAITRKTCMITVPSWVFLRYRNSIARSQIIPAGMKERLWPMVLSLGSAFSSVSARSYPWSANPREFLSFLFLWYVSVVVHYLPFHIFCLCEITCIDH